MNSPIVTALLGLAASLKPAYYEDGRSPRGRTDGNKKSGKTRRGAKHKVNPTFRSRRIFKTTPAQYRHEHRGVTDVVPNYKKPHAKPRGRNLVKGDYKWI